MLSLFRRTPSKAGRGGIAAFAALASLALVAVALPSAALAEEATPPEPSVTVATESDSPPVEETAPAETDAAPNVNGNDPSCVSNESVTDTEKQCAKVKPVWTVHKDAVTEGKTPTVVPGDTITYAVTVTWLSGEAPKI